MKARTLWLLLTAISIAGCHTGGQTAAGSSLLPPTGIDFSGVDQFFIVGGLLAHDSEPSPAQWQALLTTPGYQLAMKNLGPRIRDDIEVALRPSRHDEYVRASSENDEHGLILQHLALAWARRDELQAYRDSLVRGTPIADAVALAARYLPPGATTNGSPPLVAFALFKDDGYSFPEGIVVDLLYARTAAVGGTPLVRNLAHEFHHSYVNRMARPAPGGAAQTDAGLRDAIYSLRNEGLADLIDKPYPFHSPVPGLASYAAQYDSEYAQTPAALQRLDSLLTSMGHGSAPTANDPMALEMLFWSNGHANGAYIAREIFETFGVDSLFPAAHSPAAFIRTFRWAERRHGRGDPLSAAAWRELDSLDLRYWK